MAKKPLAKRDFWFFDNSLGQKIDLKIWLSPFGNFSLFQQKKLVTLGSTLGKNSDLPFVCFNPQKHQKRRSLTKTTFLNSRFVPANSNWSRSKTVKVER